MRNAFIHIFKSDILHTGVLAVVLTLWGCGTPRTIQNTHTNKPTTKNTTIIKEQPQSAFLLLSSMSNPAKPFHNPYASARE